MKCSFCVGHLLALQALFLLRLRLSFSRKLLWEFRFLGLLLLLLPPLGGQGKRWGVSGAPSVFLRCFLPSARPWSARGAGVPLGICLSRAGSLLLLLLLWEVGGAGVGSLAADALFPASPSLLTLPILTARSTTWEFEGVFSLCSRVLSSRESRSSGRGSRMDKRARSREFSSRGRRCRSRSRSSYRSRLGGRERGRRSSSASRFSRGLSRCKRSRSSDRYRSQRGSSRSRRAWSRSSDRCQSRRDRSRRERSRSFDRYRSRRERARSMPVGGCGAVVRDRTLSRIARVTACGQACDYLLLLPACGPWKQDGWPDVGPRRVWRPWSLCLLWPGAAAVVHPVMEGRPLPLSRLFLQELAKFFMGLSGSSSLGAPGVLAGVTASAAASGGIACPASSAAGAATFCAATVTPAGAGVFCLLLPLLFLACLVTSSVRGYPALAGVTVCRLVMGPTDVLRALQRKVSFF